MTHSLRVLLVEDSPDDAELILREIQRADYAPTVTRVETATALRHALAHGPWDIVIADYQLPSFSGLAALQIVRQCGYDLPFILVSGTIGEEIAVTAMRAGAQDYLLKQSLIRLGPAVTRELAEVKVREERRRNQASLVFLAETGKVLANSLDTSQILHAVTQLAVPRQADMCIVYPQVTEDNHAEAVIACIPAINGESLRQMATAYFPQIGWENHPISAVMRSHQASVIAHLDDAALVAAARDAEHLRLLHILQPRSLLIIPLMARGRSLGIMVFVSQQPNRYSDQDLPVAQEFGGRAALAIDNSRLFQEAQQAIRARDDFLLIAAHELRTPLTALVLQMAMLQRSIRDRLNGIKVPTDVIHVINKSSHSVERLTLLVENLLDVSRMSAGKLTLAYEEFDVAELIRDVSQRLVPRAEQVGSTIQVIAMKPLTGSWDRLRIEQLLANLLDNALKYGSGKPITITVMAASTQSIQIIIRDRGIGIPPADLQRIFGRFERAVSMRNYGGLGLGLFIANFIAQAHGGTIRAESTLGDGATFTVELPRYQHSHIFKHGGSPSKTATAQ